MKAVTSSFTNRVSTGNNKQQPTYAVSNHVAAGSLLAMSSLSEALQLCPFTGDASAGAMMLATAGFALQEKRQQQQLQKPAAKGANTQKPVVASAVQQQIEWR
jgi:hypothetical protein